MPTLLPRVAGPALTGLLVALPLLLTPPAWAGGGRPDPPAAVDPRLVGSWHAEVETVVDYRDASLVVRTTWDVTIDADGGATYHAEQTTTGGVGGDDYPSRKVLADFTGTVKQQGNTLIATTSQGDVYRIRFRLSGDNGLYLDGRLFERQ
jgi:hypothetical protein